jgi:hypothetical protein
MGEKKMATRKEIKARLQAAGQWDEYVAERVKLAADGMTPAQAREEALRRIESRPKARAELPTPSNDPAPDLIREYVAPRDDGAPAQLQDLRHVYLNAQRHDRTEAHDNARRFKDRDPKGFHGMMATLEKEHAATMAAKPKKNPDEVSDVSSAKCIEIAERLLIDLAKQSEERLRERASGG